jgi:branched-chain amino acid aminotransferase
MALPKSEFIWFNGEFVPWDEAKIHVLSHVLHYGTSVFEGIRAYQTPTGPAVLGLKAHVKRLFNSCKIINMTPMPYTEEEISQAIVETVARNKHNACYIRPLVFRGYNVLGVDPRNCPIETVIATWEWGTYLGADAIEKGVDVAVSSWRRMAPDTHPAMAKTGGNYINSQMVVMEAKRHGYVEGIVLDVQGYVSEGSGENIFVVLDGKIFTPPLGNSILTGKAIRWSSSRFPARCSTSPTKSSSPAPPPKSPRSEALTASPSAMAAVAPLPMTFKVSFSPSSPARSPTGTAG